MQKEEAEGLKLERPLVESPSVPPSFIRATNLSLAILFFFRSMAIYTCDCAKIEFYCGDYILQTIESFLFNKN